MDTRRRRQLQKAKAAENLSRKSRRRHRRAAKASAAAVTAFAVAVGPASGAFGSTRRDAILVADVAPGASGGISASTGSEWATVGHDIYFVANDGTHGDELWIFNTVSGSARMLADIDTRESYVGPSSLTTFKGNVYFSADEPTHGRELWVTDGTTGGTSVLKDLVPGVHSSSPSNLTVVGDSLFFTTFDGENNGDETSLWRTDGTSAGTVLVKHVNPLAGDNYPDDSVGSGYLRDLTALGDTLYFTADDDSQGSELWSSDGTTLGTQKVVDLVDSADGGVSNVLAHDGTIYFTAYRPGDPGTGESLWVSDGSAAGTTKLAALTPGAGSSTYPYLTPPVTSGGKVYLSYGDALWGSDGTPSGTTLIRDMTLSSASATRLADVDGTLYFAGGGTSQSKSLWKSDGTSSGTVKVADVPWSGYGDISPQSIGNGVTYFVTWGHDGRELWSSDGTPSGTGLVVDMNPDTFKPYGDPTDLTLLDGDIYFSAYRQDVGRALFKLGAPAPADTTPPDTTILTGPAAGSQITQNKATFSFAGTQGDTEKLQCRIDNLTFTVCTSPATFSNLANGKHTVSFRAVDAAGNVDPTPADRTFTVAVRTAPKPVVLSSAPRVGAAKVGKPVTVKLGLPTGAKATYRWVLTPKKIGKAKPKAKVVGHSASVKPKKSWRGGTLKVTVTVTQPGHTPYVKTLVVKGKVK